MCHEVGRGRLGETYCFQQVVECHSLPCRIELRPLCDAVNVSLDRCLRECLELRPRPFAERRPTKLKSQDPVFELSFRGGSRRKNREIRRHILSGRQPLLRSLSLSSRPETARNWSLIHRDVPCFW